MTQADCALPHVEYSLCNRCGLCVEACPCGAIVMGERGPIFSCDRDSDQGKACTEHGAGCCLYLCEEVCPTGAITCAFEIVPEGQACQAS